MNRRGFLKRISMPAGATVLSCMGAAAARGRDLAETKHRELAGTVKQLSKRLDRLDEHNRRMARAVVAVGALSVGVDLTFLL